MILFPFANIANAGAYFNSPSGGTNPTYWNRCWEGVGGQGVYVQQFIGSASQEINDLGMTQINDVQLPILEKDAESTDAQIAALDKLDSSLTTAFNDAYQALSTAQATLEKKTVDMELEYLKTINQQALNSKLYGFFPSGNGLNRPNPPSATSASENTASSAYQYFKSMCKRGKMMTAISSENNRLEKNQSMYNQSVQKNNEVLSMSSSSQAAAQEIQSHYGNYCNAYDIANGLCKNSQLKLCKANDVTSGVCDQNGNPYNLSDGDINATNFISPKYNVDNQQSTNLALTEGFVPEYTYDTDQEKAAKQYANNVVYGDVIQAPTLKEESEPSKARYVNAYNSYIASLNLAYNSYLKAINDREPITQSTDPVQMSRIDTMRYLLQNMSSTDTLAATFGAKKKGIDIALYSVMSINNKLSLDILKQKQRIKALLAALVANQANSPDEVQSMDNSK